MDYNKQKINMTFENQTFKHFDNSAIQCSYTFWYLTVSSDAVWVDIRAGFPYKRRHRFASFPMISTPTHCERALQWMPHFNKAETVELFTGVSFKTHASDCVMPDCT